MSKMSEVYEKSIEFIQECQETFLKLASFKNLSPMYNPNWETDGDFISCFNIMKDYINSQNISSIKNLQIFQEEGVTPSLFFSAPSNDSYTILFYSHIDKIPFGEKWTKCNPKDPKIIDNYVYGRGVSTSIYAIFTILGMLKTMEDLSLPRPSIAVLIESAFESGSPDLTTHLSKALEIVPNINQVICLDTCGPTNNHFHYMKSCRGLISFDLKITTGLKEVNSGSIGRNIDPMMFFNNILSNKIKTINKSEDGKTTKISIEALEKEISEGKKKECASIIKKCGFQMKSILPNERVSQLIGNKNEDETERYLTEYINGVLRPSYSILGVEHSKVENVSGSLKQLNARLCFRTPPSLDVNTGFENLKKIIEANQPFGGKVEISNENLCEGIDLEESNNNLTEEMINSFNGYCDERVSYEAVGLRLDRTLPCLNYLSAQFKNVPIFVTGAGNAFTGNPRDPNECIQLIRIASFNSVLTCYVSDFINYKK
jgi:acetylornithine deacetylase/succinyl-diaminopimelate desuccinylase-like protein